MKALHSDRLANSGHKWQLSILKNALHPVLFFIVAYLSQLMLWANTTTWNLSPYSTLELYSLINNWFIISKSFLSINFHAFRYLQTTIRKLFPKFKCHYRWKLACTASFPDSIFLMIERRSEFFRFFQFSVVSIFHRIISQSSPDFPKIARST